MGTTVTAATMTITITEEITLNGVDQGGTQVQEITSVKEVSKRIVNIGTSEVQLVVMGAAASAGSFVESAVKYIRITNLDNTNYVTLVFRCDGNPEFAVKLDYGQSFIYNGDLAIDSSGGVVDTMSASSSALGTVSFQDLVDITALANTAACDLEVMVAGT